MRFDSLSSDFWKDKSKYNVKIFEYENGSFNSFVLTGDLKSCKKVFKNFSKQDQCEVEIIRCSDGKIVRRNTFN